MDELTKHMEANKPPTVDDLEEAMDQVVTITDRIMDSRPTERDQMKVVDLMDPFMERMYNVLSKKIRRR